MKRTLRMEISLSMALIALLAVAIIGISSSYTVDSSFKEYIRRRQLDRIEVIANSMALQFNRTTGAWNTDLIHAIGMSAMNDGFIVQIRDNSGAVVWDAEAHDMTKCEAIMQDIARRMSEKLPALEGSFNAKQYELITEGVKSGTINVKLYEPFFFNENDFRFLGAMRWIILAAAAASLAGSLVLGLLLADHISRPVLKASAVAKEISGGNYGARIDEKAKNEELKELIASVNNMAESLVRQERIRKQLTEDISHEVRTPLTILQAHIEAMMEGIWEPDAEHLESCRQEVLRLGRLIKDIEKLAAEDSENLALEIGKFGIREVIGKAVASFEVEMKNKRIEVAIQGPDLEIMGDRNRIMQAVLNILSNAVKYSYPGGRIEISISVNDSHLNIRIADNGAGIPEEDLPYIFERFYRARGQEGTNVTGSGIGLSIARSIIEAHGGTIAASSKLKEGSAFDITLPKAQ